MLLYLVISVACITMGTACLLFPAWVQTRLPQWYRPLRDWGLMGLRYEMMQSPLYQWWLRGVGSIAITLGVLGLLFLASARR